MITRSAPVGAVCFRCQLRLLRQSTTFIRHLTSDASSAPRPDDDRTGNEDTFQHAENTIPHADNTIPHADNTIRHAGNTIRHARAATSRQSFKPNSLLRSSRLIRPMPPPKIHRSSGRVLTEAEESLGTTILGKPAYAIVMRDGGKITRKKRPRAAVEQTTESSGSVAATIGALLDSQRKPPTKAEVQANIEDLRPKEDTGLTRSEFDRIKDLLTRGFLKNQLLDYIKRREANAELIAQEQILRNPNPWWLREVIPWVPLPTQPGAEGTEPTTTKLSLQGYITHTTRAKERVAIRLMRESWGLYIAELHTQLGETWLKLHNSEFTLLMRGTQRFMNTLGEVWLEPGEKIEAFRNQKMFRLVATKLKAESLIRDLTKTLQSIETKSIPLSLFGSKMPDEATIEELGRITNTHVNPSSTLRRLHVTWIELKSRAAEGFASLEDMAHIVFRLLLTASGGSHSVTSTLLSPTVSQPHPDGRLIVDVMSKDKLGWKDRLTQWARYIQPLTPKESPIDITLPIEEFKLPFEPSPSPKRLKEDLEFFPGSQFPFHPVKWTNDSRTSTVAHFGQVLHAYQPSNPTPPLSSLLSSLDRRVFVPTSPHPLYFTKLDTTDPGTTPPLITTKSSLVLYFWPSPSSNPATRPDSSEKKPSKEQDHAGDTPLAPVLELRIATSDREVKGIESLRAISRTHHTDVMLPSSLVDVRFTQTQYETLQASSREALATWQPLADFFANARLDLENVKLEVPPRQRFAVPRRLVGETRSVSFESISWTRSDHAPADEGTDELVSISYEFVGLEMHRSATLPYKGHQLTYTSIEAGQGGGRRAEVVLEPAEPGHSTTPKTEVADRAKQQEDFLACCSKLAADRSLWSGLDNKPNA
ncbi:hypothetical protein GGS24DRAFT_493179 [Hypoxylon argillaceum]|nr:hypothetical protein GGS24DRAFT_493179 [Hypoxylon argillaceum]